MSRSIDQDADVRNPDHPRESKILVAPGRDTRTNNSRSKRGTRSQDQASPRTRLAVILDRAADGKPTISEFIAWLKKEGVEVLPSVQSSGRLNGLSYRFEGTVFNGSAIGRAYTARGIQIKRGVDYQPERDQAALAAAVERGGLRRDIRDQSDEIRRGQRDSRSRSRDTGLTASQQAMLTDIGKFRTVAAADLVTYRYDGNGGRFERDMRQLTERGLAERRTVTHGRGAKKETIVVLTRAGRELLRRANRRHDGAAPQQFYAGFVKPSEVPHDIGIYRMYQQEAARIEREGGTIRRVVLDFELKKRVYRELNKRDHTEAQGDKTTRKETIATRHGLGIVEGRMVLPDLRIEFETRDQEMDKVDLELTTGHYKESQIAAKRAAGLKIYAPDSALGSPAHNDPEIVSDLISL